MVVVGVLCPPSLGVSSPLPHFMILNLLAIDLSRPCGAHVCQSTCMSVRTYRGQLYHMLRPHLSRHIRAHIAEDEYLGLTLLVLGHIQDADHRPIMYDYNICFIYGMDTFMYVGI